MHVILVASGPSSQQDRAKGRPLVAQPRGVLCPAVADRQRTRGMAPRKKGARGAALAQEASAEQPTAQTAQLAWPRLHLCMLVATAACIFFLERWHAPGAGHLSGWERDAEWVGADAVGG